MELSDVRIGDDGTAKLSYVDRVNAPPFEDHETDVIFTFEEMLFRDST